ncbi:hypothetical protein C1645_830617 [Glomus cerebriforme]|uniref:Uncharacterized protein n=1 Tax=Glomus cerebriforme TaxID=658196 RepID=A0A397SH29_9GLOM|nr:hypothetical protein C1645_830617 [Glomus cerebriforme]
MVLADKSFTNNEKSYTLKEINKIYDKAKILFNEETKIICENCNQECFPILYIEFCVKNYLKANFSNWTSENRIVEWIPYNNLKNIEYLTKDRYSKIYTAVWIDGGYGE